MTPLIQRAVALAPEPETAMWFDVGHMERWGGQQVPKAVLLNLPFRRTGIAGFDSSGKPFSLWLTQGEGNVAVAGCAIETRVYFEPFVLVDTEKGVRFYRKNKSVPESELRPVIRMLAATLLKISAEQTAYKPTPQRTFINQKRIAKGKPALTFDWHTVVIEPPAPKNDVQGGTHASPRLHDRRGHWRTLKKTGVRVWVRSCKVGDASRGVVFKDYRVAEAHGITGDKQ